MIVIIHITWTDWDQKSSHSNTQAPIIQIMIILHKTSNLDRPTGLKTDLPIWHLPELPSGPVSDTSSLTIGLVISVW